ALPIYPMDFAKGVLSFVEREFIHDLEGKREIEFVGREGNLRCRRPAYFPESAPTYAGNCFFREIESKDGMALALEVVYVIARATTCIEHDERARWDFGANDRVGNTTHGDEPPVSLLDVVEVFVVFRSHGLPIVRFITPVVIDSPGEALVQRGAGFPSRSEMELHKGRECT